MYELKIITHFSAAHQLKEFRGTCEHLHGHNWKIEAYIGSDSLDSSGVVLDFRVLKGYVKGIMDGLDHKFLNDLPAFQETNPSSENIAKYVADKLAPLVEKHDAHVTRVTAWESENACATYYPKSPSSV